MANPNPWQARLDRQRQEQRRKRNELRNHLRGIKDSVIEAFDLLTENKPEKARDLLWGLIGPGARISEFMVWLKLEDEKDDQAAEWRRRSEGKNRGKS